MYNTRIKNRYLATIQSKVEQGFYKALFNQISDLEKQFGKDLCQFSTKEVQVFLDAKSFKTRSAFSRFQKMISSYVNWCSDAKINAGSIIDVSQLTPPQLKEFNPEMVIRSEQDLIQSIDSIYADEHWHFEIPCLMLSWIGLTMDEIVNLRKRRVDLENRCIIRIDKSVAASNWSDTIHKKLMEYALCQNGIQRNQKNEFILLRDVKTTRFIVGFYSKNSKKIGVPLSEKSILSGIGRLNKAYAEKGNPPRLTMKNVWNCGRYYTLYLARKNGLQIYSKQNQEQVAKILRTESISTAQTLARSEAPKYFRVFESAEN